jgi:hypothetical protein
MTALRSAPGWRERFMRRMLPVVTIAVASGTLVGGPVGAAPPDKRACPSAYELMTVENVLQIATPGFEDAIRAEDANSDGLLCVHLLPEPIPLFEPTFLYYDNNRHP